MQYFGGLAGFLLIYLINATYKLWRGHDGMGFGDVKLMAMLGVWLGPASLLPDSPGSWLKWSYRNYRHFNSTWQK